MREKELVKLRKKVYQLLKVNDATNKVSWWNLSDDVVDLIKSERERVIGEIEKEARKIFIDMRDNPDCVYVDFKGDDKRYKGEEGIALESFREGIFDYFKRLDDSINKLKKK